MEFFCVSCSLANFDLPDKPLEVLKEVLQLHPRLRMGEAHMRGSTAPGVDLGT
jgi:hypothetical protein